MAQFIDVLGVGTLEFPDDMSDGDIADAISKNITELQAPNQSIEPAQPQQAVQPIQAAPDQPVDVNISPIPSDYQVVNQHPPMADLIQQKITGKQKTTPFRPPTGSKATSGRPYASNIDITRRLGEPQESPWGETLAGAGKAAVYRIGEAAGGAIQLVGEAKERARADLVDALTKQINPDVGMVDRVMAKHQLNNAIAAGTLTPEMGELIQAGDYEGARAALLDRSMDAPETGTLDRLTETGKSIADYFNERAVEARPVTERGTAKYYVSHAIEGVGSTMIPAAVATLLTRGRNIPAGLATIFAQVAGGSYAESRREGRDPNTAFNKAIFDAFSETATEAIPLGILTKVGGKYVYRILKGATAEGMQEAINEAMQMGYEWGVLDEEIDPGEALRRLMDAGIIGAVGGAGMAAAIPANIRADAPQETVTEPTAADIETVAEMVDQKPETVTRPPVRRGEAEKAEATTAEPAQPVTEPRPAPPGQEVGAEEEATVHPVSTKEKVLKPTPAETNAVEPVTEAMSTEKTQEVPRGTIEQAAPAAEGGKVEPWQMTAKEWNAARQASKPEVRQSKLTKASASEAAAKISETERLIYGVKDAASEKMRAHLDGEINLTPEEVEDLRFELDTPTRHRDVIEKAINEGKAVPANVLAEYPDLAQAAEIKTKAPEIPAMRQATEQAQPEKIVKPEISALAKSMDTVSKKLNNMTSAEVAEWKSKNKEASKNIAKTTASEIAETEEFKSYQENPTDDTALDLGKAAGGTVPVYPSDLQRTQILEKYAGNINLERINTADDVKQAINNVSQFFKPHMDMARREVQGHEETRRLADELGMTDKQLLKRRKGQAFNAEEALAARGVLEASGKELIKLSDKAKGGSNEDLLNFQAHLARHVAIQQHVSGMTAEAGRALNQFKILSKETKGQLRAIEDVISNRDNIEEIASVLSSMKDNPSAFNKFAIEAYKAKPGDMLLEIWINSLLSGPQTHVVNMTSNSLVAALTNAENLVAAGIGKLHGGEKITFREARTRIYGNIQGVVDGMKLASEAFITESPTDPMSKIESARYKAITGDNLGLSGKAGKAVDVFGKIIRLPGRFLMAEDEFFKAIAYKEEINGLAMRQAINDGLKGDALAIKIRELATNPSKKMREEATKAAQYRTFTKPLGPVGRQIQRLANSNKLIRVILPFIRTPTNIIKFAGERSPLAVLSKEVRNEIKAGGIRRDTQLARISIGSSIMGSVVYMSALGLITGGGPDDPNEKKALYRTGWQPYSVKIGDTYYAYGRLEPIGMLVGVAADAQYIWDRMDKKETDEIASLIVLSASKNLLSKTWLRGVSDLVNAITDPERYGERWIQSLAGTAIPTGVAQYARTEDPYLRRVESLLDVYKSRTPSKSETLLPRLNLWGEPVARGGGLGPDILSPVYISKSANDKVNQEMVDIGYFPSLPAKRIWGIELTPEQHNEYIALAGVTAKKILNEIVQAPGYDNTPKFVKKEVFKEVIESSRDAAKKHMLGLYPEIVEKALEEKEQRMAE